MPQKYCPFVIMSSSKNKTTTLSSRAVTNSLKCLRYNVSAQEAAKQVMQRLSSLLTASIHCSLLLR